MSDEEQPETRQAWALQKAFIEAQDKADKRYQAAIDLAKEKRAKIVDEAFREEDNESAKAYRIYLKEVGKATDDHERAKASGENQGSASATQSSKEQAWKDSTVASEEVAKLPPIEALEDGEAFEKAYEEAYGLQGS